MAAPKIQLVLSESNIDIANNKSIVTGTLYYYGNGETYNGSAACSITIDGKSTTFTRAIDKWTSGAIGTHTVEVVHDSDGNKTISYSAEVAASKTYGPTRTSGTYICETIKRATQIALSPAEVRYGETVSIKLPAKDAAYRHILYYSTGSGLKTIAGNVATDYSWTVPESLASADDGPVKGITIFAETYSSGLADRVFIGASNAQLSVRPNAKMKPTVSLNLSDPTGKYATYGGYVIGQSKIKATLTESLSYNSPIKNREITIDGIKYNANLAESANPIRSGAAVTATVTDARGMSSTASVTPNVLEWHPPKLGNVKVQRCDSTGAVDELGDYIRVDYSVDVSPLGTKKPNTKSLKISLKKQGTSTYDAPVTVPLNAYKVTGFKAIQASGNNAYDVLIELTDDFATTKIEKQIGTSFVLMNWNASGKGMAIGKVSENDYFEVGVFSEFVGGYGSGSDTTAKMASYAEVGAGGRKSFTGSEGTGFIKIILPGEFSKRTILKFDVDIYTYGRSAALTYTVGGQIYNNRDGSPSWYRSTAGVKSTDPYGDLANTVVNFGAEGKNPAVTIGSADTAWGNCQIVIRNLQTSNNAYGVANWSDGWNINITSTPLSTILNTYTVSALGRDYIVEQGVSADWEYRKWQSGVAEAWRTTHASNLGVSGSWNNWYYRVYQIALPAGMFKSITDAHADCSWGTGYSYASARNVNVNNFEAIYYSNQNGGAGTFYHHVKGRWK